MLLSDIHIRDPFILADDGVYYLYGTRIGENGVPRPCVGLDVYTSRDLVQWSEPVECFTRPDDFWADLDFFAPEVHKYKGEYYMFVSFKSTSRRMGSQILKADSPMGKFLPFTDGPFTPEDRTCFDATLYVENGVPYSAFCQSWTQLGDGAMCSVRLSDDLSKAVSEVKTMFTAGQADWKFSVTGGPFGDEGNYITDGPFIRRNKSGKLVMTWSSFTDHCAYVVANAVSQSGTMEGPWVVGDPIFKNDGGHGMMFEGFDGKLYLVFHTPNVCPRERAVIYEIEETDDSFKTVRLAYK